MGFLDQVTSGKLTKKISATLYGPPGTGKTTFACHFPTPLIADLEGGSSFIDVKRLPKPATFEEAMQQFQEVADKESAYETFIVDTLDTLETLANESVCRDNGIKAIGELGFGKDFAQAHQKLQDALTLLKKINLKKHVVMIAHSMIRKISDPMKSQEYDRHDIKLRDKNAAIFKEFPDAILFCTSEVHLSENKNGRIKAAGEGTRVLLTQGRPSHEGKNRYSLPYRLPLDYDAFKAAFDKQETDDPNNIIQLIDEATKDLKDSLLKTKIGKAVEKAKADPVELSQILNRVLAILQEAK